MCNDIVERLEEIRNKKFKITYNVCDYITNDTTYYSNSRCKEFAIYFAKKGNNSSLKQGILIELVKGNLVISFLDDDVIDPDIDIDKIVNSLPIRFKELIAKIKNLKAKKVKLTGDIITDLLVTAIKGVDKERIKYIENHESLNSIMTFNFLELEGDKTHTLIYANLPPFGKINRQKRMTSK